MTIRFHPVVIIALLLGAGFLIYALLRGCNNSKAALAGGKHWDSVIAKLREDSASSAYNAQEYETRLELQEGQIALLTNQYFAKEDTLQAANDRINKLLKNHVPIQPNSDTTITTVPNGYIQDCEDCFTELDKGRLLVFRYKESADSLRAGYIARGTLDSARIKQLIGQNNSLTYTLGNTIVEFKKDEEKNKPHGVLYFSWGVLWNPFPSAAGMGLMYQDKHRIGYALRWYYGRYGHMAETEVNLPLSLKKR